jgi:hypothetical protein
LRHLTVLVAVLCLVAQFSSALHLLVVSHVRCAEHGNWVDTGAEHAAEHVDATGVTPLDGAALVATGGVEDHEHEHCWMCSERRNGTRPPSPLAALFDPLGNGVANSPGLSSSYHSTRTYLFAPKTSPPL